MKSFKLPLISLLIAIIFTISFFGCKKNMVEPTVTSDALSVSTDVCTTRTQSLGYWKTSNKNGTALLGSKWSTIGGAISIGCSGGTRITYTTQAAVSAAITNTGTPKLLSQGLSTFSAQLLSLKINLALWPFTAGMYVVVAGPFAGLTALRVEQIANDFIGGCDGPDNYQTTYTSSQLTEILDKINNSYDGGVYNGTPTLSCTP
jgi:hypothetical protein